jgi:hypothetical protein
MIAGSYVVLLPAPPSSSCMNCRNVLSDVPSLVAMKYCVGFSKEELVIDVEMVLLPVLAVCVVIDPCGIVDIVCEFVIVLEAVNKDVLARPFLDAVGSNWGAWLLYLSYTARKHSPC